MIKLRNIDVYPWTYGKFNAQLCLSSGLDFISNLELLLAAGDGTFFDELNLYEFLSNGGNPPTLQDISLRYERLELSNWSIEQTFASAVCFLIQERIFIGNVDIYIWSQLKTCMKYLCNDRYSDIFIEIYLYFNLPTLYPRACIDGCKNFFHNAKWNAETQVYLNHSGLKNLLSLINIDLNCLNEVINVCNFVESIVPFVLFLNKYKEKEL